MKYYLTLTSLLYWTILFGQNSLSIKIPAHPRVLVTKEDLPGLKQKINHPDFKVLYQTYLQQKQFKTDGISANGEPDEKIRQKIESQAFSYLIAPDQEQVAGKNAIALSAQYLGSIKSAKGYHPNAHAYQAVITAALVYDWCYPLLDAATKNQLINLMKQVSCLAEYCIFKNTPKQYLSGHYGEYAPTVFLAMGLAIYDEDRSVFDFAYQEQVQHFASARNPWYEAGTHHQGSQYIHVRYGNEILQAFILDKIGYHPYSKNIAAVTYRDLYANIPQNKDMDGMPEGDCHNNITMGNQYLEFMPIAASLSKDGFLQSYAKLHLNKLEALCTRAFIYYNPFLSAKSFDNLPLSRFFPSPSGIMITRTKWDLDKKGQASNAMVVLMNMKEYNAKNHTHLDIGHFGIYYKGHLALDAGIYQGKDPNNEWGKTNYVNYYARTIAHNSLLILDPNEPTPYEGSNIKAQSRDGGQFSYKNRAWDSTQEMFSAGKSAQVMAVDIAKGNAPDYSYLKGNMTAAYNIPKNVAVYPAKADTVFRSFVFLNLKQSSVPGTLIVLDKVVSTQPTFKKTWLLHAQNEPTIHANTISFESTQDGRNGRLHNTVVLPAPDNQQIETVGGPGKEYWVDGKNWGTVTQEDAGQWRVELSPKEAALSDNFLNLIQVMDAQPVQTALTIDKCFSANGDYIAISIADRIVAQALNLSSHAADLAFTLGDGKKTYQVLITDLAAGKWTIQTASGKQNLTVNKDAGTVYFTSKGGKFLLHKL